MENIDTSLPSLSKLVEQRLELLRNLAASLESSMRALARNDAEAIARGAAHQAQLCRQWSEFEETLRRLTAHRRALPSSVLHNSGDLAEAANLQAEWQALSTRIRYLTRVHWSLLRHLERSLAVLSRVAAGCMTTYTPTPNLCPADVVKEISFRAGG